MLFQSYRRMDRGFRSLFMLLLVLVALPSAALALTITSFAPAGGPPGTFVSVRGTGLNAATAVQFNGINASFSIQSDTLLTTTVPNSAASGLIRVFAGATSANSPTSFFVGNAPSVFSPNPSGGAPGTLITISGQNFVGITSVRFNGTSALFSTNSTSQIVATVPVGGSTGSIAVSNPAGSSFSGTFWYPPQITSLSPQGGVPGTPITVNGINLSVIGSVQFNGVGASFSVQNDSRLIATVPGGSSSGPLTVNGFAGSASANFFVGNPPIVNTLTPAGGPPGTVVTIAGSGFTGTTGVSFGALAAPFAIQSDAEIVATVPAGAQTGFVTVTNPTGSAPSQTAFFVGSPAAVTSFTPSAAPVGATVEIHGVQFTGATEVRFGGGVSATNFVVNNDASITAVVPPLAQSGQVRVLNPAGGTLSVTSFGVSPSILSFTPPSVSAGSATGTPVSITGYNLTGVFDVQFNGVAAGFTHVDDQHITTLVPAGATTGPITLVSVLGNAVSLLPFEVVQFTVPPRAANQGWPHWPDVNVAIATGNQDQPLMVPAADSLGGSYIAWAEHNGSDYDIRLQHLDAFGQRVSGWPANGVAVCDTVGTQFNPRIVADQVGGVIVVWEDNRTGGVDVYAQRITATGQRAPGWVTQGNPVSTAFNSQFQPVIATDGASGAFIAWTDTRNGSQDIFVQHMKSNGSLAPGWADNGMPVCTHPSNQATPTVLKDTIGGVYVAWSDSRFGGPFPFVQKLAVDGSVMPGWPFDGLFVSGIATSQYNHLAPATGDDVLVGFMDSRPTVHKVLATGALDPTWPSSGRILGQSASSSTPFAMATDGQGGAYFCWSQNFNQQDVFANHVNANGLIAAGWGTNGSLITSMQSEQHVAVIASDAQGGAFIAWQDARSGDYDVYAMRVLPNLPNAPGWPANGALVSGLNGSTQYQPCITSDGRGGAVMAWLDVRSFISNDIFAQNITASGRLGNPEPVINTAADVPNDQGGKVRIRWQPGYLDSLPLVEIASYGIWRQTTEEAMTAALASPSLKASTELAPGEPGTFRKQTDGALVTYWEGLGSVPARGQSLYSFVASTLADSAASGANNEVYMVDAHAQFGPYFWTTDTRTAHSVDNLPPSPPQGFAGVFNGSVTSLHWRANTERDLAGYRVYRGPSAAFLPDAITLVATVTDTAFSDPSGGFQYYKVESLDIHGNRSATAAVVPPAVAGVGDGTGITRAEFAAPRPSPARQSAMFTLRLPQAARVEIQIYDASGRLVRDLIKGTVAAGETPLLWDLRDDAGHRVPAGLYFGRANGLGAGEQLQRLVVLK